MTNARPTEVKASALDQRRNRSTATEAQRHRIIEMLRAGPKTTLDFRRAGIMQSQTRIHELRARGYDLPTVGRVTIADDEGYTHVGVAVYELTAEPAADSALRSLIHQAGYVSIEALSCAACCAAGAGIGAVMLRVLGVL